jgi:hypothetical protein
MECMQVIVVVNGKKLKGMLNIGQRPTVNALQSRTIEVHIIDFDGDLYGSSIELQFIQNAFATSRNSMDWMNCVPSLKRTRCKHYRCYENHLHHAVCAEF